MVLGCGSVAQCTVPLLIRGLGIEPARIHVVDPVDHRARIASSIGAGATFEQARVTPENLDPFLAARLGTGDLLLDLAWNIDCPTIVQWCRDHGVRYLNTSVELWDPYDEMSATPPLERTLYVRHLALRRMRDAWGDNRGPSAVVEHGANPGLVSHFAKQALTEIAERLLADGLAPEPGALEAALADRRHAEVAMLSGTKVIHIAERDSQASNVPKRVDEFVNTWSVEGFYEEGVAPAELGWGTHERHLPSNAWVHTGEGPCNQICIARPGMETWVRSWVPSGEIRGMVIRHGEAFTLCEHLTVRDALGHDAYRPTVHYAYHPADAAVNSVLELRMRNWEMQPEWRILNDEIVSGRDELGVLLNGAPLPVVVDRLAAVDRRGPRDHPRTERHDAAGGRVDPRGGGMDDRASARGPAGPRRPPVGVRAARRHAVPRHPAQRPGRLDAVVGTARPVRRVQRRGRPPRPQRSLAVHQLPRPLTNRARPADPARPTTSTRPVGSGSWAAAGRARAS